MPTTIQPSFARGELSPELFGRVDTTLYGTGLATAKNCIVHTYGGVSRRPGMRYTAPVKDHAVSPRLLPFTFSNADTYLIEMGHEYLRFIRNGGPVLDSDTTVTIAAITSAAPAVVTTTGAHGFSNGASVYISGVVGMTSVNQSWFTVANVTGTTFELTSQVDGTNIDATGYASYVSGGSVSEVYEVASPFPIAAVPYVRYSQTGDIITFVHVDYDPYELRRMAHDNWTLLPAEFIAEIDTNLDLTLTVNTTGAVTDRYQVTVLDDGGSESLPILAAAESANNILGATAANPVVITTANPNTVANGDTVEIKGVVGMTELNNRRFMVSGRTTTTFQLYTVDGSPLDGSDFTAWSSGGTVQKDFVEATNSNATRDNTVTWTVTPNARRYSIYRRSNGLYGFIGETDAASFDDENVAPAVNVSPPVYREPFRGDGNKPGAVGDYQQRRVYGGSTNQPDTSEFSKVGTRYDFTRTYPLKGDDAITATLTSQEAASIQHYVSLRDLMVFTSGSEWTISYGRDSAFSPDSIRQDVESNWGCSYLRPVVIGKRVLFAPPTRAAVRDYSYSFEIDGYNSRPISLPSQHLFDNNQIVSWAYSASPEGRVYMAMADGTAVSLTYESEEQVIAWTPFDTMGDFEQVAVLRSGAITGADEVYWVVKREVNGNTVRYIEMMKQAVLDDVRDCFFVDSGLTYDLPIAITNVTSTNPVVITTDSAHGLLDGDPIDLSDIIWASSFDEVRTTVRPSHLNNGRYIVASKTPTTFIVHNEFDEAVDGSAFAAYVRGGVVRKAVEEVVGLDHLEGMSVDVLADGSIVEGSVVTNGRLTFVRPFSRLHIGLPNVADVRTLNLQFSSREIAQAEGYLKRVTSVTVKFYKSRGLLAGPDESNMVELKQREYESLGSPIDLFSGTKQLTLPSSWNTNGQVLLRQRYPLPMTILAIIPHFEMEDGD